MMNQPFANLLADAQRRIEHRERILEDQADRASRAAAGVRSAFIVRMSSPVEQDTPGLVIVASGGSRPIAASATVLLPDPDSPTSASVEPFAAFSEIEDRASISPPGVR